MAAEAGVPRLANHRRRRYQRPYRQVQEARL